MRKYDYSNYAFVRQKRHSDRSHIKIILSAAVLVAVASMFVFYVNGKRENVCYAVCYCEDDATFAYKNADLVSKRGGAGYVYEQNGRYYVVTCIYAELSDAQTITGRLAAFGDEVEIVSLKNRDDFAAEIAGQCNDLAAELDRGKDVRAGLSSLSQSVKDKPKYENLSKMIFSVLADPDPAVLRKIAVCAFLGQYD